MTSAVQEVTTQEGCWNRNGVELSAFEVSAFVLSQTVLPDIYHKQLSLAFFF